MTLSTVTKPGGDKYQLEKSANAGGYRFCFSRKVHPFGDTPDVSIATAPKSDKLDVPLVIAGGTPAKGFRVSIGAGYYCGSKTPPAEPSSNNSKHKAGQGITLTTRSLEGIFFFLGEMVRTELGVATGEPISLGVLRGDGRPEFNLFKIEHRLPIRYEPWVMYDSQLFSIRVDPSGQNDASSRVVQLLTDLLALQSSAKNFPAPNLIAVTTP